MHPGQAAQAAILADRYRLVSPLGRGGMGQVWEGRDERLGRPVAVKLLTSDALNGLPRPDDWVRRFTREAVVTAGLRHPGVPAIYDAGEYDGGFYLVMELVEGCTLGDLIAEQGPLPIAWAAAIGAQIAAVLAVAHERDVIHRDIKPQNVMVTSDGTAKILDFGVAGVVSQRITGTGISVGTPAYMAPEQLNNQPATPRTDLYALGCLMYEMLSAEPVFSATSPAALIRMHLEQAPAPLRRGDADMGLVQLVWQLLQKEPAWRPSGAREVYDRLLHYVRTAGPLGDVNPCAGDESGMQLYSRLLVRLRDAPEHATPHPSPAARPVPPYPEPAGALPRPRRALRHSLWIIPAVVLPAGIGACVSFGYIGVRHQRLSWLITSGAYLALAITGIALAASAPVNGPWPVSTDVGVALFAGLWPAGFIHALWVNFSTRLALVSREKTLTRP